MPLVMVTVPALIEQPPLAATETDNPDEAVGPTAKLVPKVAGDAGALKVMVCAAFAAVTVCTTFVAAVKLASPSCDAVSVQSVEPLVIVTVTPAMEQPPLAATETDKADEAVGPTTKLVPKVAGEAGAAKVMVCDALAAVTVWFTSGAAV